MTCHFNNLHFPSCLALGSPPPEFHRHQSNFASISGPPRRQRVIRITDTAGAFRVIFGANFVSALYVLHCFQRQTPHTRDSDSNSAAWRFRRLVRESRS
jgi:phage-related protein